MVNIFNYIERKSVIHEMTGASKLACLLLWTLAAMITFNTPFLIFLSLLGIGLFPLSRIRPREVRAMLIILLTYMFFNGLLIYLFAPEHGVGLYGTRHVLFSIAGRYTVTSEQLLYQANVALKYTATIPLILIFAATTSPSELAASLNRIGISYKVSYAVSLALRYIPDTISEYFDVSKSQQARGVEMSRKENIFRRIRSAAVIILPLILSSIDRIDTVSNAMELRKFGTLPKRTWITGREFRGKDYFAIVMGAAFLAYSVFFLINNNGRYWNPFI